MKPASKSHTPGERFRIGASLIPPVALTWLASRNGWIPLPPNACLIAMPLAIALGMALPGWFAPWHRAFSRGQSWAGRLAILFILIAIFFLALVPMALLMRAFGKKFIDLDGKGSAWTPARPPGSLRDQF